MGVMLLPTPSTFTTSVYIGYNRLIYFTLPILASVLAVRLDIAKQKQHAFECRVERGKKIKTVFKFILDK